VLRRLDKGHTRAYFLHVVRIFRSLDMTLHPTFVPFTPWTTVAGYIDLLQTIYDEYLVESVAPIQLGIRLLIPEGSRMLELDEIRESVGPFDPESLTYPWTNADSRIDKLSEKIQGIVADADRRKQSRFATFLQIWQTAHAVAGQTPPRLGERETVPVPVLSEPWYCCAEPTKDQLVAIGSTAKSSPAPVVSTANDFV
jgi:hypothetical protein